MMGADLSSEFSEKLRSKEIYRSQTKVSVQTNLICLIPVPSPHYRGGACERQSSHRAVLGPVVAVVHKAPFRSHAGRGPLLYGSGRRKPAPV